MLLPNLQRTTSESLLWNAFLKGRGRLDKSPFPIDNAPTLTAGHRPPRPLHANNNKRRAAIRRYLKSWSTALIEDCIWTKDRRDNARP